MATNTYDIGDVITHSVCFLLAATKGTIVAGSNQLAVQDASGFNPGDPVFVSGAGTVGGDLTTTVSSSSANLLVLAAPAGTSVTATFVGRLAAPTAVTCKVLLPDGTSIVLGTANPSVGKYTASFSATQAGDHFVRWTGSGAAAGAEERQFVVREERVT